MKLLHARTFLSNSLLTNLIAIIISCLVAYRVASKKEPVKRHYQGYTSAYRLRNTTSSSSTNLRQHEMGRMGKSSSTRTADEEILSPPQAVHLSDPVRHQASI